MVAAAARTIVAAIGMVVTNAERDSRGEAVAYPEQAFLDLIEHEGIGYDSVVTRLMG